MKQNRKVGKTMFFNGKRFKALEEFRRKHSFMAGGLTHYDFLAQSIEQGRKMEEWKVKKKDM